MTKRKETKEKSPAVCRALPKNISHSNFGGDKTRYAQTVSPLIEILAPFLTPDTMPEGTDLLAHVFQSNSANGYSAALYNKGNKNRSDWYV